MVKEMPINRIASRYILHETIGQGGMGIVYRATDRLTRREVALKRVTTDIDTLNLDDSSEVVDFRIALAREFKLSASMRHPNVIDVLDYGFDDDQQPYYTMELLQNPQNIVEAAQALVIEERINLIIQMLYALTYLHRRGIIHRDLKPANVLVVDGRVKVLDFGLSIMHERTHQDFAAESTVGTLAYMAPETLTGVVASLSADLYAVGMMSYEMIAGRHPFNLEQTSILINQILMEMPDLNALAVSEEIAEVIERLLQKDPETRYLSAIDVVEALKNVLNTPFPGDTAAIRDSFLQAARFVGRDSEMQQLFDSLQQVLNHHSHAWLIAGESGVGKSRIIEELRTHAMVNGALVMRGQSVSVGGQPYQMWQMALHWLCLLDDFLTDDDLALLKLMIPDLDQFVLRDVSKIKSVQLSPGEMQSQMVQLLDRILHKLKRPVVMLFEDLHWAGSESLQALSQWTEHLNGLPLMVIGSYRDDERPTLHEQLPKMEMMKLNRLNNEAIAELSAAMLGDAGRTPQVVDLLRRESEGNVFFVVEVVRSLAETVGDLEEIAQMTLPMQVFAGGVQTVIERRLSQLNQASRNLLQYAAIMGRILQLDMLQAIDSNIDFNTWLTNCVNAAVIEVDDDLWFFSHDKLRLGLIDIISVQEKQKLHEKVARTIERHYGEDQSHIAALAYHWGSAGNVTKEERYVVSAGKQALRTGAYTEAIEYFVRAVTLIEQLEISDIRKQHKQVELKHYSGEAHLGFGDYQSARKLHQEALLICEAIKDKISIAVSLGYLGDIALALDEFDEARDLYGRALSLYQNVSNQAGIARTLNRLGDIAYELGDDEKAKQFYQESLQISRQIGEDWGMAGASRSQIPDRPATGTSLDNLLALLALARTTNDLQATLNTIIRVARVYMNMGAEEPALELLAFLLHYENSSEQLLDEIEQSIFTLQESLPPEASERAWEKGKKDTLENVLKRLIN
jgi:serine/threonine protein kinase/tetratricopeptide (TPR) repeat protein